MLLSRGGIGIDRLRHFVRVIATRLARDRRTLA